VAKILAAGVGLIILHYILSRTGTAAAAAWMTGGLATVFIVWFGLSRA
jgi:hypothetical protein